MNVSHWDEVNTLFRQALEMPQHTRAAFLDQACKSDAMLRAQVEALLNSYNNAAGDVLEPGETPKHSEASLAVPDPTHPYQFIGQTISHYQVIDKLGSGGMGIVYRAEDIQLGRFVALKFLPPHLSTDDQTKTRFITEAKAACALDHTNICTIYEIGETRAGQLFIAMAYYDGETLKEIITRGPLALDKALDYARQIARGLEKAHAYGIIHRDIKPGNVVVTSEGVAKIVDFGLAKMADVSLTQTGATLGTVAYMSPEQARGAGVDHRTDIWSLGVVIYEMLTGERPFAGDYAQAIIYSLLNESPPSLIEVNPIAPMDLQHVVAMCLEKDKDLRYPTVTDLLADLDVVRTSSGNQTLLSGTLETHPLGHRARSAEPAAWSSEDMAIVVLPFDDISPGKDNEYFSDGLTEEIISDLSQVKVLSVISRTSAMMLKGTHKSVKVIGRELNVRYVLEGSVRKAGNKLRITAQLIDAHNDVHLWAEKYKGTLDDIFDIQETVSRSIVEALEVQLTLEEDQVIAERPIPNVQAYECYLRARHEIWKFTESALGRAVQELQNGLDIVGENALLFAGMGYVHWQYVNTGCGSFDHLDEAETYARMAFELEPDSAYGYRLLGLISVFRGDVRATVRYLKQALTIDPNDPDALFWISVYYGCFGKTLAARSMAERLLKVDPLTPINYGLPGWLHFVDGRFDLAESAYRKMYQMDPLNPIHCFFFSQSLGYTGSLEEAYTIIDQHVEISPENPFTQMCLLFKFALQGEHAKALEVATPDLKAVAKEDLQYSWFMTVCQTLLHEKDEALEWLENAVSRGFINYPFLALYDPMLEPIRGEERFQKLMEQVKTQWQQLEV